MLENMMCRARHGKHDVNRHRKFMNDRQPYHNVSDVGASLQQTRPITGTELKLFLKLPQPPLVIRKDSLQSFLKPQNVTTIHD